MPLWITDFTNSSLVFPLKGWVPYINWYRISPIAQISRAGSAQFLYPVCSSGGIYLMVPASVLSLKVPFENPAIPKSTTLIYLQSYSLNITFSNLRSLCIIPLEWLYYTADIIYFIIFCIYISSTYSALSTIKSLSLPPDAYSIMITNDFSFSCKNPLYI
jgi:hypothetical protein